jgi:hypothetical protein
MPSSVTTLLGVLMGDAAFGGGPQVDALSKAANRNGPNRAISLVGYQDVLSFFRAMSGLPMVPPKLPHALSWVFGEPALWAGWGGRVDPACLKLFIPQVGAEGDKNRRLISFFALAVPFPALDIL